MSYQDILPFSEHRIEKFLAVPEIVRGPGWASEAPPKHYIKLLK